MVNHELSNMLHVLMLKRILKSYAVWKITILVSGFFFNMMFHTLWQLIFVFGGGQYYAVWNVCLFIKFWRFSFRSRNLDFVFNISISFYVLWKFNDDILHIMHACIDTGVRKGPYNPGIFQFQNFVPPPPLSQKTIVKLSLCIWILKIFLDSHPHP